MVSTEKPTVPPHNDEPRKVSSVGLVLHPRRAPGPILETVFQWARDHGVRVFLLEEEIDLIRAEGLRAEPATPDELGKASDVVVAMGGDGTVLRALHLAAPYGSPVLGVNLGRLGFLADIDPPDLPSALQAMAEGRYSIERRLALALKVPESSEGPLRDVAYNDVVLSRVRGQGQAAISIEVDGHLFARYSADAVIVSTPTGSTAYNFSAGGPIVSPRIEALLVTPVAPHAVFNRTLLVHPHDRLRLEVLESSSQVLIEVDGHEIGIVEPGTVVELRSSGHPIHIVRLGLTNFYDRARTKLRLGDSPQIDSF